jgi:hypothetical protein
MYANWGEPLLHLENPNWGGISHVSVIFQGDRLGLQTGLMRLTLIISVKLKWNNDTNDILSLLRLIAVICPCIQSTTWVSGRVYLVPLKLHQG